ncbi:MFS transporter [Paenibacillus sp. 276b]|uniref:MFS transporter n=1 Tax=Paenibacillus sp. 276b TaxID=1566277 RepID=UPI0008967E39|nr:glycoside-pentoside-hexuronide (GPH):cation symporter [Paenibacillus sp. 276b]SEA61020.1 glycoside/pentoside/hexuronide:cation symporter, GPH family [Paenibacillus sp. 276b]
MERELTTRQLIGDAAGQFSLNIVTSMMSLLLFFYTEIIGVSAGIVGTVLLLTKIVDSGADIGMGYIVDRTKSKHGQARPWLLWMIIPMFVLTVLVFTVPDLSTGGKITYIVITNLLFYVFMLTPTSIPYASLMALTTRNTQDRSIMGLLRSSFGFFAGGLVTVDFIPLVNLLGGGQQEWISLAAGLAFIAALGIFIVYRSTVEKYNTEQLKKEGEIKKTLSLKIGIKLLFTNRYWLVTFFVGFFTNISFALASSSGMYYAKYIWGNVNLVGLIGGITLLLTLLVFAVSVPLIKRFGQRNTAILGLCVGIIGSLVRSYDPYSIQIGIVGSAFQAFATIPLLVVMMPLITSTIEYGEWKHGQRIVGLTNSINSLGNKLGMAFGTALIGWLLAFGHFQEGASEQVETANSMIVFIGIYLPLVMYVIMAILLCFYSLEKQYTRILDDLSKRRDSI